MRPSRTWLFAVTMTALFVSMSVVSADAAVVDSIYSFTVTFTTQSTRDATGPRAESSSVGQFQIQVYNVTPSDRYEYNYYGYSMFLSFPVDRNDTVDFQDNKVSFDLFISNSDDDDRAESASIRFYPYAPGNPGRDIFVNPTWSTHETDWNDAVSDAEDESTVASLVESVSNGQFSLDLVVDIESTVSVGTSSQAANGTITFDYDSFYDEDGVLSSHTLTTRTHLQNENYTSDYTTTLSIVRGGAGGLPPDPALGTTLVIAGGAAVAGLVIGVIVGRKFAS
ncbi:MAG: hypothetical protein JSW61_09225 [Candidatus Thorarchaeota archaeon]|nr:MAG: hypothetical protein JSW61_09225 [Candidatus Thorarchaeota archaeon]